MPFGLALQAESCLFNLHQHINFALGSKEQKAYSPILSKQCMMASCVCSSYRKSDAEREEAELRPAAKNTTGLDTLLLGACCMFANNSQGTHSLLLRSLFLTVAVSG